MKAFSRNYEFGTLGKERLPEGGKERLLKVLLKVLYVCTGNICRSPLAEALLKNYVARQAAGIGAADGTGSAGSITVSSAGTYAWNGNMPTPEAIEAGRRAGLDITGHRARQVTYAIMRENDIILAATREHHDWLCREFPDRKNAVYLALLFPRRLSGQEGDRFDIPDPIGENVDYYLEVLRMLEPTLPRVIDAVREM